MNKILFIVPPYVKFESFINPSFNERTVVKRSGTFGSVVTDMPIGLLSLSAYVKKHADVEVRLVDFNIVLNKMEDFEYSSFSELFSDVLSAEGLADYSPDIIGISTLFTPAYYNMIDLAGAARDIFPDALIVAGGGVPTNMYREIFRGTQSVDALCYGEGERPLLELIKANDRKDLLKTHPSWITRDKAEKGEAFQHDLIDDLDEIPFLDYDLLDTADYNRNSLLSLFPLAQRENISLSIMTSRGCPHRCCFCSSHTVHGRKMRYNSMDRVREDFKRLKERYGAQTLVFFDDHLMAKKERVLEIIDVMRGLGLVAFFPNSLALYALDRKILEALRSIGVEHLVLSVESGSNRVLKQVMHKPLDLSIVERVIADCRDLGIATDVSILIGLPGETKQDIEDARAFFKTIKPTWFRISIATPLVGSEMLEICIKNDYIKGDYADCDFKTAVIETEDFSTEYLEEKAYALNLELNFVENGDFKLGNYETALKGFENTIKVKSDHALAYYFAAKCYKMMGLHENYLAYKTKFQEIIESSAFWKGYADEFNLTAQGL